MDANVTVWLDNLSKAARGEAAPPPSDTLLSIENRVKDATDDDVSGITSQLFGLHGLPEATVASLDGETAEMRTPEKKELREAVEWTERQDATEKEAHAAELARMRSACDERVSRNDAELERMKERFASELRLQKGEAEETLETERSAAKTQLQEVRASRWKHKMLSHHPQLCAAQGTGPQATPRKADSQAAR